MRRYVLPVLVLLMSCATAPEVPYFGPELPPQDLPYNAVVRLVTSDGMCSAVMVAPRLALTAAHCVPDDGSALNGSLLALDGSLADVQDYQRSDLYDIAVIEISEEFATWAKVAPKLPKLTERTWNVGYGCPPGGHISVRPSFWGPPFDDEGRHILLGVACGGDSGGPLFNERGEVVGVVTQRGLGDPSTILVTLASGAAEALEVAVDHAARQADADADAGTDAP